MLLGMCAQHELQRVFTNELSERQDVANTVMSLFNTSRISALINTACRDYECRMCFIMGSGNILVEFISSIPGLSVCRPVCGVHVLPECAWVYM